MLKTKRFNLIIKIINSFVFLLSSITFITGCGDSFVYGPGVHDFDAPLCGGYEIVRSSAHQIHVAPICGGMTDTQPIIPAKVVELGHDERFIIAKQNHLKRRSPHDPQDTYMEPDPGVFSYWILDTKTPQVYGPFSEIDFAKKREELHVLPTLKMQNVYLYKK